MSDELKRAEIVKELRRVSRVMDSSLKVPFTKYTFGFDSLIGLIPGGGDVAGLLVSLYLIARARQLDLPRKLQLKMLGNILVDAGLGTVPVVGDVFDFFFKANNRNVDLVLGALSAELPDIEEDPETEN